MGVVVQEVCPNCKKDVYMAIDCPQIRCPHCNDADIRNSKRKISGKREFDNRFVFQTYDIRAITCPKCGTNFTSSPALNKGKIFCPNCANPMAQQSE